MLIRIIKVKIIYSDKEIKALIEEIITNLNTEIYCAA